MGSGVEREKDGTEGERRERDERVFWMRRKRVEDGPTLFRVGGCGREVVKGKDGTGGEKRERKE